MVGQRTLNPFILVRIQVSQQKTGYIIQPVFYLQKFYSINIILYSTSLLTSLIFATSPTTQPTSASPIGEL